MQVGPITARLFADYRAVKPAQAEFADGRRLAELMNRQVSGRMGIVPGQLPGNIKPIYGTEKKVVVEDVVETRQRVRVEPVHEDRVVMGTRDIYELRDVIATRDVTEMRDVYETQAVYEEQDVYATRVEGTRNLTPYNTLAQAGIDVGADFSVKVGNGPMVAFEFDRSNRLSVTVDESTQRFTFTSDEGSMRGAIVAALDSVEGLSASLSADGRLQLETSDAQSLKIADIANGLLDFSGSPLAKLGLTAGTTNASVVGTEEVQTGTQQVLVGTETVVIGTEQYVAGQESVVIGSETYAAGIERVQVGERSVVVGTDQVRVGTRTRVEIERTGIVGLTREDDRGLAGLNVLDRLAAADKGLPDGYLDALFGALNADEGSFAGWSNAHADYGDDGAGASYDDSRDAEPVNSGSRSI